MSGVVKKPFGVCGRCGFRYRLNQLRVEVVNFVETSLMVCPECFDPDQPQNHLGTLKSGDRQWVRDPRPDLSLAESRNLILRAWSVGDELDEDYTGMTLEEFLSGD